MRALINLPPPGEQGIVSLEEAIVRRRPVRDFARESISLSQLSQVLWAAQGITDDSFRLRSVPSAGATYPLEIFVVCGHNSIDKMEGAYTTTRWLITP
jgi:hypothetical protein